MTRKTPDPAPAGPVDNQPVTTIECPFDLPQVGGSYTLEPGAKTPVLVEPEAPLETPVKEA